MCALIKSSIFSKKFLEIKNVVNIFLIPKKKIPKKINYCMLLGHTLAKSYDSIAS